MQVEGRIEVSGDRHSDVERKFTLILLLGFGVGFCDCHMHRLFLTPKIHRVLWFSESYNNKGGVGMYEGLELLVVMLNVDSRLRSLCYRIYLNFVSLFKTFHLGLRVMICFPMDKIDRRCECTQAILNFKIHQCQCKIVYSNPGYSPYIQIGSLQSRKRWHRCSPGLTDWLISLLFEDQDQSRQARREKLYEISSPDE